MARTDCVRWLDEVEGGIPSVVFEAKADSGPVFDVSVTVDGVLRVKQLDGRPLEVDPGLHTFAFDHSGSPTLEQKVILREGQKSWLVVADWTTPKPEDKPARALRPPMERPVPVSVYVTAGIAVAGFADFAIAGLLGSSLKSDLQGNGCAPFCARDQVDALRTRYIVADVGLAVGVAQLATAVVLFLTRPEHPAPHPTAGAAPSAPLTLGVLPGAASPSGLSLVWRGAL